MNRQSIFLVLSLFAIGCGSAGSVPADRPVTHPVSGTITYNGAPVESAMVTFRPNQGAGQGGYARTDKNGFYRLSTFMAGDGAEAGSYAVVVTKREITLGDPSYGDPDSPNYGKETPPEAEPKTVDLLPVKYAEVATSGLAADVTEGENSFKFDLVD